MQRDRMIAIIGMSVMNLPQSAALSAKKAVQPLVVRGDGVVPASVGGVAGRMRISPWAPAAPTLNPDYANRIGLRPGWFGVKLAVGPVRVGGASAVTRLSIADAAFKRRVVWFDRRYAVGADGAVGPGGLPAQIVRFDLRAPITGERTVALPLVQQMFRPATTRVSIGGQVVTVLFDPQHRHTLATAGAGAAIASAQAGQLTGPPGSAEIAFGIERPVRTLRLGTPLSIGPLAIASLSVRIADGGSLGGIADADADPDEIVVAAGRKSDRRNTLIIGRDQLDRCSSIVFDKPAKVIRLTCG